MQGSLPSPVALFNTLLHADFTSANCYDDSSGEQSHSIVRKETLKREIKLLEKERSEYLNLLHIKKDLKATLQELLNYRQSIDYDHKYKQIKFDHYRFPYSDNLQLKQQLNNARLENVDKRKKIKEMEQELKRKQQHIDQIKLQKHNYTFAAVRDTPTSSQKVVASDDFWVKRIENIKSRYLSSDNEYKRAKIRHDYNLLVEKDGCRCVGMRVCPVCSDLNF